MESEILIFFLKLSPFLPLFGIAIGIFGSSFTFEGIKRVTLLSRVGRKIELSIRLKGISAETHDWINFAINDWHSNHLVPPICYWDLKMRLKNKDAFNHAAMAFLDEDFVNAYGKLKIISTDKKLQKSFESYSTKEQRRLLISPIMKAMELFKKRFKEYEDIVIKTKRNELNLVLNQNPTRIQDFNSKSLNISDYSLKEICDFCSIDEKEGKILLPEELK